MIKTLILLLCAVSFTASFQINAPLSVSRWRRHLHSTEPSTVSQRRTPTLALDLDDDNDSVTQQDYLTPTQVKTLRKEANKRKTRKELKTLAFSDENAASQHIMAAIVHLLEDSELIEIRGISRNEKRHVRRNAERLALEIEMELMERPVFLLDTKGHAATYYSPGIGDFELRTGYREGQWSKKPRPKRDSRGKIIKGEYE